MKEFLKHMLIEPFTDRDWLGYIFGILMWTLTIAIFIGFIWLIDSSFLQIKEKEGVVIKHYYVPAHTSITYIKVGGTMVPQIHHHNDSFEIIVNIDGLTDKICIEQNSWNNIKIYDRFCFKYSNGRIFRTLYIKSFCLH